MAAIETWFKNLPIITKSYMTACCVTTFAIHLDIIKIMDIYLNFQLVYEKFEVRLNFNQTVDSIT
jgi:Derlin-2/3